MPAHGRLIDAAQLVRYREYLTAVQTQTRAAKRQGQSVEAAQAALAPALAQQFSDLAPQGGRAGDGPHQRRDPGGVSRGALSAEPQ